MLDPIEQLCIAIGLLHTAVEEVARRTGVDVHELLEASDCINARVLALRYGYPPWAPIGQQLQCGRLHNHRKVRRPTYLRVVK